MAENAYIVAATRTPGGKKNGSLSKWHPADIGAAVLSADNIARAPALLNVSCLVAQGARVRIDLPKSRGAAA